MDAASDAFQWNQLLDYIEAGLVVPIVGRDLLWTDIQGSREFVPAYVGRQLAIRAGVAAPDDTDTDPVCAVVQRFLAAQAKGRNWPYTAVSQLARELESTDVPVALRKLSEVPFRLFVSTTWDNYMERALNLVRFGGRVQTIVPPYGLGSNADLSERGGDGPATVFPLLGRANTSPDYALTDEDVLEFVHQFHVTGTPRRLFETLRQSHILLIGGLFSDWLTRFVMRLVRANRLWTSTSTQLTHFFADRSNDQHLLSFLRHPMSDTEVFTVVRTEDFVDELHRRWTARHPIRFTDMNAPVTVESASFGGAGPGGVFLSYASEDYEAAARVHVALDRAGIDVWFDRRDLHAGEEFERKIAAQIARSYFFVAVVSKQSLTREPRFFRFEWREAEQRAKYAAFDLPYVLPVVIDDTPSADDRFPAFVTKVHWTRAPGGDLPPAFIADVVKAYRQVQRPQGRS